MDFIFAKIPKMSSRFSLEGATTVTDVLNSASSLGDNDVLPLDYIFQKRDTTERVVINNKLEAPMDILQLNLYLLEFRGNGDRAREDVGFLSKRLEAIQNRMDSLYERRVLATFNHIQENCKRDYGDTIRLLRKKANDWWKEAYKLTNNTEIDTKTKKLKGISDEYRWYRIQRLKEKYGDEWENFIWRILDIDDIGQFFTGLIPIYKRYEENCLSSGVESGIGVFGNLSRW